MIRRGLVALAFLCLATVVAAATLVPTAASFNDTTQAGAHFQAAEVFPPFDVSGNVTSTQDGSGVAGATVTLDGAEGEWTGTSDGNGAYTVSDVPPGTYQGSAAASGFASSGPQDVTVEGDVDEVNFELTPLYRVEGRVTGLLGVGATNTTVTFTHTASGEVRSTTTYNIGLQAGHYNLPDVRAGTHSVTLTRPLTPTYTTEVNITTNRIRGTNPLNFRTGWVL